MHLRRRPLAAAFTFLAVLATLLVFAPDRAERVPVVAAARDLPAGTVLGQRDLTELALPPEAVPGGAAAEASELVGQTLNAPVTRHSPVTSASVAAGERLARPGFVVVALPLTSNALAPLIKPGTHLDLIDESGTTIASDVRVLAAPDAAGGGLGLGSSARAALIEVEPAVAMKVATGSAGGLTIALR